MEGIERARAYLASNDELRAALGVSAEAELRPQFLGHGEHNDNFWFADPATGTKYVLRINVLPQPFHDNQVAYEHAALEALRPSRVAPEPLYLDDSGTRTPQGVLVISFCEGEELDFDHLRPGDLRCAAQLMADIHATSADPSCPLHRPTDPLRDLYGECMQRFALYRASAYEDERITRWVERFIAATEPMLETTAPSEDRTHIINSETLPSHFLIPASAAQTAASATGTSGRWCTAPGSFVDWERPLIGEVAQDVAYFVAPTTTFWDSEYLFPASQVEGFLNDYWRAVDGRFEPGSFEERFRAWQMVTALRSTTWCCKALIQYNAADPGTKRAKTAAKLPVYLSDDFMTLLAEQVFRL